MGKITDKLIEITDNGYVWHVPLHIVADNRARYYASKEGEGNYQDEYDYVVDDNYEAIDWFQGNMDWSDVSDKAILVKQNIPLEPDLGEAELKIIERQG